MSALEWLGPVGIVIGIVAGTCAIFATMWAVMRLLAPLNSLQTTLDLLEKRTRMSANAARRASREASVASKKTDALHGEVVEIRMAVELANQSLKDIQDRSRRVRLSDETTREAH